MPKKLSFFKFYSDNSGVPYNKDKKTGEYEAVVIGLTSISRNHIKNLLDKIKQKFPDYWDLKGNQLKADELELIIKFLDRNHVMMLTVMFEHDDWDKYRKMYPHETHFGEKVMAILYFFIIKHLAFHQE